MTFPLSPGMTTPNRLNPPRSTAGGSIPAALSLTAFGRLARWLLVATLLAVIPGSADARVGGGQSFSGQRTSNNNNQGGHHAGGGGGVSFTSSPSHGTGDGGRGLAELLMLVVNLHQENPFLAAGIDVLLLGLVVGGVVIYVKSRQPQLLPGVVEQRQWAEPVGDRFEELRKHDPNFSEPLFYDFLYTLYARVHEARGRRDLATYSPYLDPQVAQMYEQSTPPEIRSVGDVIVGGLSVVKSDFSQPEVFVTVLFEANYTETRGEGAAARATQWYVRERWKLVRQRDVRSKPPGEITALHCPSCGGPLEKRLDGACTHCGVKVVGGDFDWFVSKVRIEATEDQGPAVGRDTPDEGTEFPTVYQQDFETRWGQFQTPEFSWPQAEERFRHIFLELQRAWTSTEWEKARPYETDNIFQMHRYWMEAYKTQGKRNVLDKVNIGGIEPVKVLSDAFYDSITVRIFASMQDYTVDQAGKVVSGNPARETLFSEYWTFIRRRGVSSAAAAGKGNANCPNCAAPLSVSMAGVCEYCGGKITSGEFDWVLSRIEQDETYQG